MSKYLKPVCRGSWALGTACGKCERCLDTKPVPANTPAPEVAEPVEFEARHCPGIPTDCCDYGVVSHVTGKEVCRVWSQEDAVKITALLNAHPPQPDALAKGDIGEIAASIRVSLYKAVPGMPNYPVGIVEPILRAALATKGDTKEPQ